MQIYLEHWCGVIVCLVMPSAVLLSGGAALAQGQPEESRPQRKRQLMNYTVVTPEGPDDGGDFGPNTPGTKTSGIQEALDFAAANSRDVYISGGGYGPGADRGVGYKLEETLRLPWRQNARIDGGEYWLTYMGERGPAVVIDSQMNCHIKMGLVVGAKTPDAVVKLFPTTKGPDKLCCLVANTLEFNGMVGSGDVWGKADAVQKGIGLAMDASQGGIVGNRIFIQEINACEKGVVMSEGCHENDIEVVWSHLTTVGMEIGSATSPNASGNTIRGSFSCGLPGGEGLRIFGRSNQFVLRLGGHEPGKNIIFERTARDNYIVAGMLPQGFTNHADVPTNRLVNASPVGYNVATLPVPPSGKELANRHPYTVEISIAKPGKVLRWTEIDANGTAQPFEGKLQVGQRFLMNPGDKIRLDYEDKPVWVWKAIQ